MEKEYTANIKKIYILSIHGCFLKIAVSTLSNSFGFSLNGVAQYDSIAFIRERMQNRSLMARYIYATESLKIASSYFHRLALLHDKETTCHATAHFSLHSFYFYVLNFFSISLLMLMLLLLLLFSVRQLLFRISRLNKRPKGCEMNDDFISIIRILYSF